MSLTITQRRAWTWAAVGLLLLYFISRLHNLLLLPLFLDEASHITRAQWVWQGRPFYLLETGKALAPYLAALFWPFSGAPFIGRYVVVLLSGIGIASAYGVGQELHSRNVGLLCMALWIIYPQLMFFERMALVDASLASMGMLTLWLAIRMVRSGRVLTAILCGAALMLCILAKLTGLVFIPIPFLTAILIPARTLTTPNAPPRWLRRLRQVVIAYLVFAILMVGPVLYILSVNADPTGQSSGLTTVPSTTSSLLERVQGNGAIVLDTYKTYFSTPMWTLLLIAAVAALIFAPRRALLLLALIGVYMGAITAAAAQLWLRYTVSATPFMLLIAALGFALLIEALRTGFRLPRWIGVAPWLVAGAWAILIGLPFQRTAYADPTQLPLAGDDKQEYIDWVPSGYGIREAATYLRDNQQRPVTVIGTAVNCNAARLYMPLNSPVTFVCPDLDWGGGNQNVIGDIFARFKQEGTLYVLGEEKNPDTVPVDALPEPRTEVQAFPRPGRYYVVHLYRIGGDQP